MGLRSGLPNLGPPRCRVADLAAPIQLAPAAQQSKIKSAHQPPRSYRGQPLEAPQPDEARKAETLPYIERLRDEFAIPMVYVTHNWPEIEQLRAEVVRIEDGRAAAL